VRDNAEQAQPRCADILSFPFVFIDFLTLSFVFIEILALFPEFCATDVEAVRDPPLPLRYQRSLALTSGVYSSQCLTF